MSRCTTRHGGDGCVGVGGTGVRIDHDHHFTTHAPGNAVATSDPIAEAKSRLPHKADPITVHASVITMSRGSSTRSLTRWIDP